MDLIKHFRELCISNDLMYSVYSGSLCIKEDQFQMYQIIPNSYLSIIKDKYNVSSEAASIILNLPLLNIFPYHTELDKNCILSINRIQCPLVTIVPNQIISTNPLLIEYNEELRKVDSFNRLRLKFKSLKNLHVHMDYNNEKDITSNTEAIQQIHDIFQI